MTLEEAARYINLYVRFRTKESNQHWTPARLIGIRGRMLEVRPFKHRKNELVPPQSTHLWAKGNHRPERATQPAPQEKPMNKKKEIA